MTDRSPQQARDPEPGNAFIYQTSRSPRQEKFESLQDMQMHLFAVQSADKHLPKLDEYGLQKWKLKMGQGDPLVGEQPFTLSRDFSVEAGYTFYSLIHDLFDMDAPNVIFSFDTVEHIENEDVVPETRCSLPAAIEKFYRSGEALSNAYQQYLCLVTGAVAFFLNRAEPDDEAEVNSDGDFAELLLDAVEWGENQIERQSLVSGKAGFAVMMSHELRHLKKIFYESMDEYPKEDLTEEDNHMLKELEERFKTFTDNIETYFHVLDALAAERKALLKSTSQQESSSSAFRDLLLDIIEKLHDESYEDPKISPEYVLCVSLFEIRNGIFMTAANALLQQSDGLLTSMKARGESMEAYFSYEFEALMKFEDYADEEVRPGMEAVREHLTRRISLVTELLERSAESENNTKSD